jgi:hypothetical protein
MIDLSTVWHKIQAWLYPNHFKNVEGTYIAKASSNRVLTDEDICKIMKTRLELPIRYEDLLNCIRQYNAEIIYQACDGHTVKNEWFMVLLKIGGSFNGVNEAHDHDKHKITFRFSPRAKLRKLARSISVEIAGIANINGYIDTFTDLEDGAENCLYIPGHQFIIHGSKIRVEGSDPGVGVFMVPENNPSGAVRIRTGENKHSKITGILPSTGSLYNRIEVRTQYSGVSGRPNKKLRVITSTFILEETV